MSRSNEETERLTHLNLENTQMTDLENSKELPELLEKFFTKFNIQQPGDPTKAPEIGLQDIKIIANSDSGNSINSLHLLATNNTGPAVEAKSPEVIMTLGNQENNVDLDVSLHVKNTSDTLQRTWEGLLKGDLSMGTAKVHIEYDLHKNKTLIGKWKEIQGETLTFYDLPKLLGIQHSLPIEQLEIELSLSSMAFEFNLDQGLFSLVAESKYGRIFFVATNHNDQWDFISGLIMSHDKLPNKIGNISKEITKISSFKQICCLFSTMVHEHFVLPQLPNLEENISENNFTMLSSYPLQIEPGISLALNIELSGSNNILVQHLHSLLPQDQIILQTKLDNPNSLTTNLGNNLLIEVAGEKFVLRNAGVDFILNPFDLKIRGSIQISMGSETLDFKAFITLAENKGIGEFRLENKDEFGNPRPLPVPLGFQGIQLDDIGVNMGWIFQPPSLVLGLEGSFHVLNQIPKSNQFIIMVSLVGQVPNPILFYSYFEKLDLDTIYIAVTGKSLSNLADFLNKIVFRKSFLYWSQIDHTLPDGTIIHQGFGVNTLIDVAGLTGHASLEVQKNVGIKGSAEFPPFQIKNVLFIGGQGKGVTIKEYKINGEWVTAKEEQSSNIEVREKQIISPGGALLEFNTIHSPYLNVSLQVTLLELIKQEVQGEITGQGLTFKLEYSISNNVQMILDCTLTDQNSFSGKANFSVNINGEIGPFKILSMDFGKVQLDIDFKSKVELFINPLEFKMIVNGDFEFEGINLHMPELKLDASITSMKELPQKILDQISKHAEEIFSDFFNQTKELIHQMELAVENVINEGKKLVKDAIEEGEKMKEGATKVVEAVGTNITEAEKQAKAIAEDAVDISQKAKKEIEHIGSEAQKAADDLKNQAKNLPNKLTEDINKLKEDINKKLNDLTNKSEAALRDAEQKVKDTEEKVKDEVIELANQANQKVKDIEENTKEEVNKINEETKHILDEISNELKKLDEEKNKLVGKATKLFKKRI
ncbi:hypothetical protein P4324_11790 [Bacillus thuringiensis]|nr:hypothetical protein [Bacillus thuringiensis]MED2922728.1 hypothetical protein [Bacillus thuringiensis]MED3050896.1 hypothetical protein [Bacillus thuringiensis]